MSNQANNNKSNHLVRVETPLGAIMVLADYYEYAIYVDLRRPDFDDLELACIDFSSINTDSPDEKLYMTACVYDDATKYGAADQVVEREMEECFCKSCGDRLQRLFDSIHIEMGDDPRHQGVHINLRHPDGYDIPLVLVEYSTDDTDNPTSEPRIATYIWGNPADENYTRRVVHRNIEEYFSTEEDATEQDAPDSQADYCHIESLDEPLVLRCEKFTSAEWAAYCKLAGGLPTDRTTQIIFHVDRIVSYKTPQAASSASKLPMGLQAETPMGTIIVGTAPEFSGITINLRRPGADRDMPIALIKSSEEDGADNPTGEPALTTYVWGDAAKEDYTDQVAHRNIDEYFHMGE